MVDRLLHFLQNKYVPALWAVLLTVWLIGAIIDTTPKVYNVINLINKQIKVNHHV